MSFDEIHAKLQSFGDPERVELLRKFFKTGPGHYGEGDIFLDLRIPQIRNLGSDI